jgi:LPXTG-site transpeptidase (sortase) family protein
MSVVYKKAVHHVAVAPPRLSPSEIRRLSRPPKHRLVALLPAVLVTLGSMLIANVAWPILSYQLFVSPTIQHETLVSPVESMTQQSVGRVLAQTDTTEDGPIPSPVVIGEELDFTNLALWFPSQTIPPADQHALEYTISIPALGVEEAHVKVGGLSLDQSLIQYPGTANPGELGAPIIFGHSVSPLFYNPSVKNPKRYTSIFTKIMQLKKNDEIIVNYDGITYTYRVTNKTEVKPDDTYILEQRYDTRELKLVTCTPPGTFLRRGIVFAQLEDLQKN